MKQKICLATLMIGTIVFISVKSGKTGNVPKKEEVHSIQKNVVASATIIPTVIIPPPPKGGGKKQSQEKS